MSTGDTTVSSSTPSGAPALQVDLPGLTSLVARVGIAGLKKMSQAGVDVHTIGCMLALGELTPATQEFRIQLQQCRASQRKETWFIHAIVEYGAGTNFVVDELLKSRAGENLMALLASVISILDTTASAEVITKLFEAVKADAHQTPSLGQLQAVRAVALPLVRKLGFGERVANMHLWLLHHVVDRESQQDWPAGCHWSLPDPTTLAALITLLKSLSMQETEAPQRLIFDGLRGAAWVIVYATSILKLSVCVLLANGKPLPVSETYGAAIILLRPTRSKTASGFHLETSVRSLETIMAASDEPLIHNASALVRCGADGIDLVTFLCGWNLQDRQDLGNLIFSVAMEYVHSLCGMDSSSVLESGQFVSYFAWNEQELENALRQTLFTLGVTGFLTRHKDWREQCFCPQLLATERFGLNGWFLDRLEADYESYRSQGAPSGLLESFDSRRPVSMLDTTILDSVVYLAYLSSCLALSDWAIFLRHISMSSLDGTISNYGEWSMLQHMHDFFLWNFCRDKEVCRKYDINPESLGLSSAPRFEGLCFEDPGYLTLAISYFCNSPTNWSFVSANAGRMLGINLDGILLIEKACVEAALSGGPRFFLRDGQFSLKGDQRPVVTQEESDGFHFIPPHPPLDSPLVLQPCDSFPNSALKTWATLKNDSIALRYQFTAGGAGPEVHGDVDILRCISNLHKLVVGLQCVDECTSGRRMSTFVFRYTDMELGRVLLRPAEGRRSPSDGLEETWQWRDAEGNHWSVRDSLIPRSVKVGGFILFQVLGNPLGQWAAASFPNATEEEEGLLILQGQTCLDCIASHTKKSSYKRVFIITGG